MTAQGIERLINSRGPLRKAKATDVTAALFGALASPLVNSGPPFGRSAASMPPWAGAAGAGLNSNQDGLESPAAGGLVLGDSHLAGVNESPVSSAFIKASIRRTFA